MIGLLLSVFSLLMIVHLSNVTRLGILFGRPIIHVFHYQCDEGEFQQFECPEKGRNFGFVLEEFSRYSALSDEKPKQLYRCFKRHPLRFYAWYDYLTHPRWRLPYMAKSNG